MAALALFIPQSALSQEAPAHGRVSFADASALVKGTSEDEWSFATLNSLVLPGDTLWAVESGVVEIEFSAGSILRMADGSKLDVTSLPPAASLRGWNGSFYIHRMANSVGTVQFESPVASISVDADSQVRVDILSEGSTTVTVRWGHAVINAEGVNPVVVGQGKRSFIDPGFAPSTPLPFDRNIEDDFDSWNRERARLLVLGNERSPIVSISSQAAPMGVADLNSYGEWIYTDNDYYWRPTYVDDYVPYRNGYWNYEPSHGHVWIGSYPFSYTTSHYGYWDYHDTYGYIWHHDGYWSPGHVAALRYGDYFVWSPINRYGNAIHHGSDYWSVGGLNFSTYGTSYAYAHDVLGGPHPVYGYGQGNFGNVVADDIYIWNIDINSSGHGGNRPNPYGDSNLRVRDYEPRRVMRGPSSAGRNGLSARAQVASLRSTQSRDQFRARGSAASSLRKPTRTANAAQDRTARIRTNSVQSGTISTSRNTAQRAARSSRETSRLVMRRSGVSTGVTPASTGNVVQSNPTSRRARASNRISSPTRTITNADAKGPSLNRSIRSTRPQASARSRVSTSAPELRGDATGRSRVTRQAPNAANGVTSTNSRRSTFSRPVNTSRRVRAAAPSSPVTASTNRYSQRTNRSSVNQLAPTRRSTSRTITSPPSATRQSAPVFRTPSRTAPSRSLSRPSPARVAPSRSLSRPSPTRVAPSSRARTQAPSARARSPRSVSRPSRSSVRSNSAPSSSRSISAPSRGRSYSAPSRSSAPRSSSSISSSRGGSSRSGGVSSSRGSSASRGGSRSPRSR
jgi:hypothetical protein